MPTKILVAYAWLKPVTIEMFVGKYGPAKLSIAHKMLALTPMGDHTGSLPQSVNLGREDKQI